MFGCFGAKVVRLHRISMGGLQLPSDLREGQCRELTAEELEKVSKTALKLKALPTCIFK